MANVPKPPTTQRRLEDMERRIKALETASRLRSASIGEGGLTIRDGGELRAVNDNGDTVAGIGRLDNGDAYGLIAYDQAGNRVLFAGDSRDQGNLSNFTVWDANGEPVLRLDSSGKGLGSPRVSYPLQRFRNNDGTIAFAGTDRTTERLLWTGTLSRSWPYIQVLGNFQQATGAAGGLSVRVSLELPRGTQRLEQTRTSATDGAPFDVSFNIVDALKATGEEDLPVLNVWGTRTGVGDQVSYWGVSIRGVIGRGTP